MKGYGFILVPPPPSPALLQPPFSHKQTTTFTVVIASSPTLVLLTAQAILSTIWSTLARFGLDAHRTRFQLRRSADGDDRILAYSDFVSHRRFLPPTATCRPQLVPFPFRAVSEQKQAPVPTALH